MTQELKLRYIEATIQVLRGAGISLQVITTPMISDDSQWPENIGKGWVEKSADGPIEIIIKIQP